MYARVSYFFDTAKGKEGKILHFSTDEVDKTSQFWLRNLGR